MTRVLMISDVYFPRINGVSTSIATFRDALREHGVETRLVVPRYGSEAECEGVVRVPGRPVPRDPEDRLARWHAMREAAVREAADCDLVHVHTPFVAHYAGRAAARAAGIPLVLTYHTLFEEYLQHYAPFLPASGLRALARSVSRSQCNEVDAVVVPSTAMQQRLGGYGVRTPLHVIPTGIPIGRFEGGDGALFRADHRIPPEAPVALYLGRVAHEKNIAFLLDVAQRVAAGVPGFMLLVAGEGPALGALQRSVERRSLQAQVRFVGYLDRAHGLRDCYAAADVFVFASRTETQGLVLLEAMAAGVPVVALSAMGTADILDPGRGAVAPADDVAAFAHELGALMLDAPRRARLGTAARLFSREWSDARMAQRLAALYGQMLRDRRASTVAASAACRPWDSSVTD